MSHYSVAVITKPEGKSLDELLAPYDESIEVAPYIAQTRDEVLEEAKRARKRIIDRCVEENTNPDQYWESLCNANTDEDVYKAYTEDNGNVYDDDGNRISTYNPNSKWDWYYVGGRWSGHVRLKDEYWEDDDDKFYGRDEAPLGHIDFSPDKEDYDYYVRFWELVVEGDALKDGETEPFNMYKTEYYTERYKDKYEFAERSCRWSTYAVVDEYGVWHEPGQMMMFACTDSTPDSEREYEEWFDRYMDKTVAEHPDWTLTIVDCHI